MVQSNKGNSGGLIYIQRTIFSMIVRTIDNDKRKNDINGVNKQGLMIQKARSYTLLKVMCFSSY